MIDRIRQASRRQMARFTGVVYLLYFLTAIIGQLLLSHKLVVYGNTVNLIGTVCYTVLTLLFYAMFKPVNRSLSLLAALFSLAGCVVMTCALFPRTSLHISPLLFFGPYCLLIGYLILRSAFLPHVLGVLMALAGVGWLAFLFPIVAHYVAVYIEALGILAEASLMLWLIVMGVNAQRWNEQAAAVAGIPYL